MSLILQIVDGHDGALLMDLNATAGGLGIMQQASPSLWEQELSGGNPIQWSPLAGPVALGNRQASIPFVLVGASADDVGSKVASLAQLVGRPWWLRVRRHGGTQDCWLQCFGGVPQVTSKLTTTNVPHIAIGQIACETAAYALGPRVDGSHTVDQDPFGGAWTTDINDVGGDTATPLLLRFHDSTAFAAPMSAFISVRRRKTPSALSATAITTQGQDSSNTYSPSAGVTIATLPSGTTSSELSGGDGARATFASGYNSGALSSITWAAPSLSGQDVPGLYRAFVRIRRQDPTESVGLRPFVSGSRIVPDEIFVPGAEATEANRVVDLGLVQWPAGMPAGIVAPVTGTTGATPTSITLQFWRNTDGAGRIDFDWMAWIPADEDAGYLTTEAALSSPSAQWVVVDGYQHQALLTAGNPTGDHVIVGQAYAGPKTSVLWEGRVPRVRPGTNRLFVMAGLSALKSWPKTQPLATAYSYWPRYTWLR